MARVTVEDCIEKIPNRFELVMLSAQRARRIGAGAALLLDRDNDKNSVVALREIAESRLGVEDLKEEIIRNNQRIIEMDDDSDIIDSSENEERWNAITAQSAAQGMEEFSDIEDDEDDEDLGDEAPGLEDLAGGSVE